MRLLGPVPAGRKCRFGFVREAMLLTLFLFSADMKDAPRDVYDALLDIDARINETRTLQTLSRVKAGWRGTDDTHNTYAAKLLSALDAAEAVMRSENRSVLSGAELDGIQKASNCKVQVWTLRSEEEGKLGLHAKKGALAPGPPANLVVCGTDGKPVAEAGGIGFGYIALAVPKVRADELCARHAALVTASRQRTAERMSQRSAAAAAEKNNPSAQQSSSDGANAAGSRASNASPTETATGPVPTEEKEKEVKIRHTPLQRTTIRPDEDGSDSDGEPVTIQLQVSRLLCDRRL